MIAHNSDFAPVSGAPHREHCPAAIVTGLKASLRGERTDSLSSLLITPSHCAEL